jgi:SAM-dependent methyltransferase
MKSSTNTQDIHPCELNVISSYDNNFAALYRCVWDRYLGDRQEMLLNQLFQESALPVTILDAASGTGELAVRLAQTGRAVTANELSGSMRKHIHQRASTGDYSLRVVEPGVCWRHLPGTLENNSFGLVICIGAALAHCDNSKTGILQQSLSALASLTEPGGFLLLDCKRYAEDGRELKGDGTKRPLDIADAETVEWTDSTGKFRSGTLRSSFCMGVDRTLTRAFNYRELGADSDDKLQWTFRTWPVGKEEVCEILHADGMHLLSELTVGGAGDKLPVDSLLFKRDCQL